MEWALEDYPSIIYDNEQSYYYYIQDTNYTLLDIYDFITRTSASWQDVFDRYTLSATQFDDLRAFVTDHDAELAQDLAAEITSYAHDLLRALHGVHRYSLKEVGVVLAGVPIALFLGFMPAFGAGGQFPITVEAGALYLVAFCLLCASCFAAIRLYKRTCSFQKRQLVVVDILKRYTFTLAYTDIARMQIHLGSHEFMDIIIHDRSGTIYRIPCSNTMKVIVNQVGRTTNHDWLLHVC